MGNDVTTRVGNYMPNTHPYLGNYTTADNLNGTTTASGCRGGSPAAWSTERVTMHDDVITEALNRQDGAFAAETRTSEASGSSLSTQPESGGVELAIRLLGSEDHSQGLPGSPRVHPRTGRPPLRCHIADHLTWRRNYTPSDLVGVSTMSPGVAPSSELSIAVCPVALEGGLLRCITSGCELCAVD